MNFEIGAVGACLKFDRASIGDRSRDFGVRIVQGDDTAVVGNVHKTSICTAFNNEFTSTNRVQRSAGNCGIVETNFGCVLSDDLTTRVINSGAQHSQNAGVACLQSSSVDGSCGSVDVDRQNFTIDICIDQAASLVHNSYRVLANTALSLNRLINNG